MPPPPPTYTRREAPLLGRSHRVRAIIYAGLRREFRRPAAVVVMALGILSTTAFGIVFVFLAPLLIPGQALDLSFFYIPASNFLVLLFTILMASIVGSGLIADDIGSMALTLYLSRPITHADYLTAKAAILGPLIAMIAALPLLLTPFVAALLGAFPWDVALLALGIGIGLGALFTAFFTAVTLLLSSLTSRKAYAAAGVFAIASGLTIPSELLASAIGEPAILYLSPWQDFLAVARAAYGAAQGPLDWAPGLAILVSATVLAALVTYVRMKALEVVTG